jgi:hypothetical protein
MAKKKEATASVQEGDLDLNREAFCQYYTKNQEMFGNATRSYAEAFGYKLDEMSREPQYEGKGKKRKKLPSEYDRACAVCATEGGKLLRKPEIQERITALLNELLRDDIVDSQLAKIITQDDDLQSKVRAINEYNKVRGRIIDKTRDVTERFAMDDIRELLAPLPQERQDEIYAILTAAVAEAEALRGSAQIQEGHTQQP